MSSAFDGTFEHGGRGQTYYNIFTRNVYDVMKGVIPFNGKVTVYGADGFVLFRLVY